MSQIENQIENVEINMEQAKASLDRADALDRLYKNKDFMEVIVKGFFEKEASRSVLLRADPQMASDEHQKNVNDIITSIGGLYQYFNTIFALADMSRRALTEDEKTREELLQEQLQDGAE